MRHNFYINYSYDSAGNLHAKNEQYLDPTYGYPSGSFSGNVYEYTDTEWKDKLTKVCGDTITYDESGNPLSYRDDMTITWEHGRQLSSLQTADNSVSYKYDSNGMRTQKTDNSGTTYYYYDSDKNLIGLTKGNNTLLFYYDSDGNVTSFKYGDTMYYYVKNLQGDVVKIINQSGTVCASYVYDAWGNIKSESGEPILRELNPFRYRSYVYDTESGLYYLQSRYYDPFTGRFLNADDINNLHITSTELLGSNIFAYCNNNPIMFMDTNGQGAIIGAIFGALVSAGVYFLEWKLGLHGWSWFWFGVEVATAAAIGAINGGLSSWAKFIRVAKHAKIPKLLKSLKNPVLNFLVPLASKGIGHIIKKVVQKFTKRGSESWASYTRRVLRV
ncbi:RHS repeat domain-containing protein [Ruminococcus sp.]